MKIYRNQNVFDAALERIRYIFDEFPNIIIGFSGGKDSTVTLNLALKIAKEKNRLPLKVMFIDQEAEWQAVIDYIRVVMSNPDITPLWYQMPIKIFNATSTVEQWLMCWEENKKWIRDKEDISIKKNIYGTDRFKELFDAIIKKDFQNTKTCILGGVRAEESPQRLVGLTNSSTYKHITYGKKITELHYIFYPLYDWSYTDIWKAIHDNKWEYCKIYDYMYQYGVPLINMRVSNVHHETATTALYVLQEIEPDTWQKLSKRIAGINTAGQMKNESFYVDKLPYMFSSWKEYRDYLLDNLIIDKNIYAKYYKKFSDMDYRYRDMINMDIMYKMHINVILSNDHYFTKIQGFECGKNAVAYRKHKAGKQIDIVKGKKHTGFIKESRI